MGFRFTTFVVLLCFAAFKEGVRSDSKNHEKWVVITSIASPTPAVIRLASMPEWQVVVVADKKTPKDWAWPGVEFLSVDKQEQLTYHTSHLVPWNSYGRKNIGYLWAIAHGAKVIYETDDDNILIDDVIPILKPDYYANYVVNSSQRTVNVYDTYGQPNMWPRGLPLADVKTRAPTTFRKIFTMPSIQQGLANHDPDVDAIYRLTQPLAVNFSSEVFTTVIPMGTMCPFNSQNTVFLEEALWGLLLPVTTTMRVCDIWRGYWAQRLLWEIGGRLCFLPPTVVQHRNVHTLEHDYLDELDLYKDAGRLVDFLRHWTFSGSSFPEAVVQLSQDMARAGFWLEVDADLTAAWVQDLTVLGYKWPQLVKEEQQQQDSPLPSGKRTDNWEPIVPTVFQRLPDVILIVMYNRPVPSSIPQLVQRLYQPIFGQVVHTGFIASEHYGVETPALMKHLHWVDCWQHGEKKGIYMQECQARAMHLHAAKPSGGYLVIGDDTAINICLLTNIPRHMPWISRRPQEVIFPQGGYGNFWHWSKRFVYRNRTLEQSLHNATMWLQAPSMILGHNATHVFGLNGSHLTRSWGSVSSDIFYIPSRHRIDFIGLSMAFVGEGVHAEVSIAHMIGLLADGNHSNYVPIPGKWLWKDDRTNKSMWGLTRSGMANNMTWVHAIKLSGYREDVISWWSGLTCTL